MTKRSDKTNSPSRLRAWFAFLAFGIVSCCLYGFGAGMRSDIGILLVPLVEQCSIPYEDVSFCVAVMQLVFGASQPAFGILANRKSNRFVLLLGVASFIASLVGMALATGPITLFLSLGVLFGLGAGAISFGLVLTSSINFVGQERAMTISGMLNAAAGLGSFVFSPVLNGLVRAGGMGLVAAGMLVPFLALIPIVLVVTSKDKIANLPPSDEPQIVKPGELFKRALHNRTFVLLIIGFTTCGFHMVIIETHLFSQYVFYGIPAGIASWVFSLYGIFTIVGALLSGWLSMRVRKGRLLGFYYGFRAIWVLVYIFFVPKTIATAVIFSAGLGMTGDATVSPTSGLVNREFKFFEVATLIGVLFFCHQIGAFFSAWLGGVLLDVTGGYDAVWLLDVALCAIACVASLRIPSRPLVAKQ